MFVCFVFTLPPLEVDEYSSLSLCSVDIFFNPPQAFPLLPELW